MPLDLNLSDALETHFGFRQFREGQATVIGHLLAGKSAAAVFPTGGGKSLCYQLPALLLDGVTLVVSPLIALMKDQIDALTERNIAAARLDSSLSLDEYRRTMQRVRAGDLKLLYVAPERFQNERFRETMEHVPVSLFAVDEAHCISEWGHNFRPDYLKLVQFAGQCGAQRLLALTATATERVLDDICRALAIEPGCAVRNSSYRPNLTLLLQRMPFYLRDEALVERLRKRPPGSTIVYVTLQKSAEEVADLLSAHEFPAKAYHAGMDDDDRRRVQDWFMSAGDGIVVATIAFGMGIDKADIRYVYHYNLPKSLENYAQEIGRAGRDGAPSTCEMFVCADDLTQLEQFARSDTPQRDSLDAFVQEIFRQDEEFHIGFHELAKQVGVKPLVARTLITYLELDGFLTGGTPFYASYKFRPKATSQEILAHFSGERRQFVHALLRQSKKQQTWFHIDLNRSAQALATPRERVVRALDYLAEQGWLELQATGTRNRYRRVKRPNSLEELAADLHRRAVEREQHDLARLAQVVGLADQQQCQVAALCAYFGETRAAPCGHCSACLAP